MILSRKVYHNNIVFIIYLINTSNITMIGISVCKQKLNGVNSNLLQFNVGKYQLLILHCLVCAKAS